ncbi:hypothetical protein PFISCL1PPCAC_25187, partial [Pristionchus fissidentatus]
SFSVRFILTREDLLVRRGFLASTRTFIDDVREHFLSELKQPRVHQSRSRMASTGGGYKYSKLEQEYEESSSFGGPSSSNNVSDMLMKQDRIIRQQDDDLELVGQSMGTLKAMSGRIGAELEQQSIMLDELGEDMERVDSKLNGVMKKIAKLTNLEDDSRQCKMIIILSIILFFLVFLLIVL